MLPKVSDLVYLQVASSDEYEANREYKSRIAEMDDNNLYIEIPLDEKTGRYKPLHFGDELSVYFVAEGGIKNYFNSYVCGFRDEVVRMVAIKMPAEESITKIQRRNYLRVAAELEMAVKLMDQVRFIALTEDVSGGGLSFRCDGKWHLKPGQEISCWLLLHYRNGSVEHSHFHAEAVRVKALENGKQQVMMKFSKISDTEQQKIIRYCFERQFEIRKH
ncbi:glycosyl transferase [Paenibacillus selenitireducens]|uniref:Glycosyl transferase n=1 Tax=Paenibacillus selenitireducens TaxID=1324314 RepID=A0A1T2XNM5_9BACL|nr:flagellar brake domain-containing protein [Paenibacillus selenitireducens]OPA81418.1 glycosyl transferase [Paenibacillus selenitireducens]